jgi:hypothetical protein
MDRRCNAEMDRRCNAEIVSVTRKKPDFVVFLCVSGPGGGGGDHFIINLKCLEILMRHFDAKNHRELAQKTFEVDELHHTEKVFRKFFSDFYPKENGIKIVRYSPKPPKYNPMFWKITAVFGPEKHYIFGKGEEDYYIVRVECHKKGYLISYSGPAFLREKTLGFVMKHFGVRKPKRLIGKEFRANCSENAQAAMLILALRSEYPELV